MKVVILAGGRGRRLGGEASRIPKPLVRVGGQPILWHVIRHFVHHGFDDFIIATGYLGHMIDDYIGSADLACDILVVNTGLDTATGGRLKRLAPLLHGGTFMMTWADAVADIDLRALIAFHRSHGCLSTVTAVHPPARFGRLLLDADRVTQFSEKQPDPDDWINGAFFVLEQEVIPLIDGDDTPWEAGPMQRLVEENQMMAYRHDGFWQCADTMHEFETLDRLWESGSAPWRVWSS